MSLNSKEETQENKDSIAISVNFKSSGALGFNIVDKYYRYRFLEFINDSKKDTTIIKKIPRLFKNQLIDFYGFENKGGKPEFYENYFLIDSTENEVSFNFSNDIVKLVNEEKILDIDSIHSTYNKIGLKIKKVGKLNEVQKKSLYSELENIYKSSPQNISKIERELIKTYYINILQMIYPQDKKIDDFLKSVDSPVACNSFSSILFNYIKNQIKIFDYNNLNSKSYPKQYVDLISIGVFNFLRFEDNKGKKEYQPAKIWLKTTDLYKSNSVYIEKEISLIDNQLFKKKLEKLVFFNVENKSFNINQIIKNNPSKYYLIDFWATWCAPCIEDIKIMKGMQLPDNIKVISISSDKKEDEQKWIKMTKKLEQSISYRLDAMNLNSKDFANYIEMKTIPRYILIDENLNLIDQAFCHPNQPQFLSKLKGI